MPLPDIPDEQFDLGVLLVHGIGESTQGQTLLGFGEPLLDNLRELLLPPSGGGPTNASASVRAAWLTAPEDGGPARAEVQIDGISARGSGPGSPLRSRWLLAEGWWAETFPTPTYREFLSWALGVLPATLLVHFDRRFRRASFALSRALSGHIEVLDALRAAVSTMREGLTVALALALTPLALLVILLILVVGALPFASMHKLAANAQRLLAATVGDSYVFMHQSITRATICARVRRRLEWLSARCNRIAVVAHSQGAAVAHRVLRDPVTAPCDLLITFGSGLSKLTEIERGAQRHAQGWMVGAIGFAAVAAAGVIWMLRAAWTSSPGLGGVLSGAMSVLVVIELGMLALLYAAMRQADRDAGANGRAGAIDSPWPAAAGFVATAWVVCLLLAFLGSASLHAAIFATLPQLLTIVGLAGAHATVSIWQRRSHRSANVEEQGRLDRALFLDYFELRNRPDMRWFDYYASADPVSNGQLLDHFEPDNLLAARVCNSHSLLSDHTSYWHSADDFVQRVARNLVDVLRLDGPGFASRAVNPEGARRRAWRTRCFVVARWVLVIVALVLGSHWTAEEPTWLLGLRDTLLEYEAVKRFAWLSPAFGWIAALAVWAIVRALLAASWIVWQQRELRTYFAGQPFDIGPPCLWLMFSGPVAAALVAMHTVGGSWAAAVAALLLVSALLGANRVPRFRTLVQRLSRSGAGATLEALDRSILAGKLDEAMRARDKVSITQISAELRWLDAPLAIKGLHTAAYTLRHANAAWLLGGLHDHLARKASHASDTAEAATQQQLAMHAYARGARLGDPLSARWAAYAARKQDRTDAERLYLRRAFRLGDASAAHSMGLRLMQDARANPHDRQRAVSAYEEGLRRGDKLSAQFLAAHYEESAGAATGVDANALRERAVRTYRAAFDLGSIRAAILAGNLRRQMKNLPASRRAYEAAIRMRSADAAVRLGVLEEEEEQDEKAALAAYALASKLDRQGDATATAMLRAGKLLERSGRDQAAAIRYRTALEAPGSGPLFPGAEDAALAGVALANLLEKTNRYGHRAECRNVLVRAMALSPTRVADAFVSFLARNSDESEQFEQDLRSFDATALSAAGLVTLARLERDRDPQRERNLLEQARKHQWGPGREEAAAAYYDLLIRNAEHPAAEDLLDELRRETSLRTDRIAAELDRLYRNDAARRLREEEGKAAPPR